MTIEKIFCVFSPVGKKDEGNWKDKIKHTEIKSDHAIYAQMMKIANNVKTECDLNIIFKSDEEKQKNIVRNMIIDIMAKKDIVSVLPLIERLSQFTDNKSKSGLVFILLGTIEDKNYFLISRYPAEEGIIFNKGKGKIDVEILDEVFLKNSHRYKLAFFEGKSLAGEFWKGLAIDKQINEASTSIRETSEYWLGDFLQCSLEMTNKRGSTLFAKSLRVVLGDDISEKSKEDVVKMTLGLNKYNKKKISINKILEENQVEKDLAEKIISKLPNKEVAEKVFQFSLNDFSSIFNLRVKYLDTGAILVAPNERFGEIFTQINLQEKGLVRYTTEGVTTNETVRSRL
jgi:hypothetical protein